MIANIPITYGGGPQAPRRIIIHVMGEFIRDVDKDYYAPDWLKKLKLSAHAMATPSGVILHCHNEKLIAWHAKGYNTDSLGIEFLVPGIHTYDTLIEATKTPYLSEVQYQAGVEQIRTWMHDFGITQVDRHSDVDPKRRWFDPGAGFPWERFQTDIGL
jgi:N-acetyl-anhydromuramyl-L-alanine amidase AmpD